MMLTGIGRGDRMIYIMISWTVLVRYSRYGEGMIRFDGWARLVVDKFRYDISWSMSGLSYICVRLDEEYVGKLFVSNVMLLWMYTVCEEYDTWF
jgi:hypothetical protein